MAAPICKGWLPPGAGVIRALPRATRTRLRAQNGSAQTCCPTWMVENPWNRPRKLEKCGPIKGRVNLPPRAGRNFLGPAGLAFVGFVAKSLLFGARKVTRAQVACASLRVFETNSTVGRYAFRNQLSFGFCNLMIPVLSREITTSTRIGRQPVALAAAMLLIIVVGAASIALWRAYTGTSPELDRIAAVRQLQAKAALVSEQLVEKNKGLEATQQESIDQLQVLQDQLQTVRRALAAQQANTKQLSEQVSGLTEAVEGLRQSFASARANESAPAPAVRNRSIRTRAHAAIQVRHRKLAKSRS